MAMPIYYVANIKVCINIMSHLNRCKLYLGMPLLGKHKDNAIKTYIHTVNVGKEKKTSLHILSD